MLSLQLGIDGIFLNRCMRMQWYRDEVGKLFHSVVIAEIMKLHGHVGSRYCGYWYPRHSTFCCLVKLQPWFDCPVLSPYQIRTSINFLPKLRVVGESPVLLCNLVVHVRDPTLGLTCPSREPDSLKFIWTGWLGAGLTGDGWMKAGSNNHVWRMKLCRSIVDTNESKESGLLSLSLKLCSWFTFTAANEVEWI